MTQAFPLQWPHGRPRAAKRGRSAFKVTAAVAYGEMMDELHRYGAGGVVVSSNAPLRRDGAPYGDALGDRLEDPGVAVYFTRKKRLVCLSCDSFELPFENIRAIGLSVKAYRDMERWGAGQIVDQAFEGFAALPPPAGAQPWRDVLGLAGRPASKDAVAAAYKALAREAAQAGDDSRLLALNVARDDANREVGA